MANLFKCGGGSGSNKVVIPKVELGWSVASKTTNDGMGRSYVVNSEFHIPDDVKKISVGDFSCNIPSTQNLAIYVYSGSSIIKSELQPLEEVDIRSRKDVYLSVGHSGDTTRLDARNTLTLTDIELTF